MRALSTSFRSSSRRRHYDGGLMRGKLSRWSVRSLCSRRTFSLGFVWRSISVLRFTRRAGTWRCCRTRRCCWSGGTSWCVKNASTRRRLCIGAFAPTAALFMRQYSCYMTIRLLCDNAFCHTTIRLSNESARMEWLCSEASASLLDSEIQASVTSIAVLAVKIVYVCAGTQPCPPFE